MKDYIVPILLQAELGERAHAFCKKELKWMDFKYYPNARGKFIYLYRLNLSNGSIQRLGRLTYEGDSENMEFAIYNSRSGRYDPVEERFSGSKYLDGTIEGALRALSATYPV